MEPRPGTYALVLALPRQARVRVGRLGSLELQAGYLVYVGSAFGPGGVLARVTRHRSRPRRRHWHIDYLHPAARLLEVWFTHDPVKREHLWAAALGSAMGGEPVERFGASDCRCVSHLHRFDARPSVEVLARHLFDQVPDHGEIRQTDGEGKV